MLLKHFSLQFETHPKKISLQSKICWFYWVTIRSQNIFFCNTIMDTLYVAYIIIDAFCAVACVSDPRYFYMDSGRSSQKIRIRIRPLRMRSWSNLTENSDPVHTSQKMRIRIVVLRNEVRIIPLIKCGSGLYLPENQDPNLTSQKIRILIRPLRKWESGSTFKKMRIRIKPLREIRIRIRPRSEQDTSHEKNELNPDPRGNTKIRIRMLSFYCIRIRNTVSLHIQPLFFLYVQLLPVSWLSNFRTYNRLLFFFILCHYFHRSHCCNTIFI